MAYPSTLDAVNLPPLPNSQGFNNGPFLNGANLYVLIQSGAAPGTHLACYKSVDTGNTWVEMDLAHEPVFNPGGWVSCVQSGTKIFAAVSSAGNTKLAFFDMATDLWTVVSVAGAYTFPNVAGVIGAYIEDTSRCCNPISRSDGSFVIPYIGTEVVGGPTFSRTRFDVWNGAAWTVADTMCGENGLANNDFCVGSVLGSGDRTHVFYLEYNTKSLKLRTIKSDNSVTVSATVIGAGGIFDPGGAGTQSLGESIGRIAFNPTTGEIAIPFKDAAGHLNIATAISGDAPVWTLTLVDNTKIVMKGAPGNAGAQVSAAFYTSAGLNIIFIDSTFLNFFLVSRSAGVWGSLTLLTSNTAVGFFQFETLSVNDFADSTARFLMVETTGGSAAYFQAAIAPPAPPVAGPVSQLYLDQNGTQVLMLPWPNTCCTMCDQMKETCLPRAFQRGKMIYGRRDT